jgi:hypothetical protein
MQHLRLDQRLQLRPFTRKDDLLPILFPDPSNWPRLAGFAVQMLRSVLTLLRPRRRKLIFVERAMSGWSLGQAAEKIVIHLRSNLIATNPGKKDGLVVARVQIDQPRFLRRSPPQECHFCDVAGERVSPLSPGVLIPPRTATMVQIAHPFEVRRPPSSRFDTLSFRVIATDQLNHRHIKRIKLRKFGS